jgi:hypothetical protein
VTRYRFTLADERSASTFADHVGQMPAREGSLVSVEGREVLADLEHEGLVLAVAWLSGFAGSATVARVQEETP